MIDGRYVGYILNSYWNDPIVQVPDVVIRSEENGDIIVSLLEQRNKRLKFKIMPPLSLYEQVRKCYIYLEEKISIEGPSLGGSGSVFYVRGKRSDIICKEIEVVVDNVTVEKDGEFWLEADKVVLMSAKIQMYVKKDAKVGWAGIIAESYPWNKYPSELQPPYEVKSEDLLTNLVEECSRHLPDGGVINLTTKYHAPPLDETTRWIERDFPTEFPCLIDSMIKNGLATSATGPVHGDERIKVHFKIKWSELLTILRNPSQASQHQSFIDETRQLLNKLKK